MRGMPWEKELEVARRAATLAGWHALGYWDSNQRRGPAADEKSDGSPVTAADRECEQLIARTLEEAFPDDGLLGEEGAAKESQSGRRWIIDPIDGTRDFLRGTPVWSVLIGLEADGEVAAGVAHLAAQGETYFAAHGCGAWRDDARIHTSDRAAPAESVLCINNLEGVTALPYANTLLRWMAQFWAVRSMGGSLDAMLVASGAADVWIEPRAKPWDLAPLKIIAEEAGARFFNFDGGRSIAGGNCVICAPGLEAELRRFIAQGEC
jgi:histidinol-phosphatase